MFLFVADVLNAPTAGTMLFLALAIALALSFEFVNGFHDTANAVATVIYTNTLKATPAVIWSGICNLAGVLLSSGAVAFGIVSLLPVDLVIEVGSTAGFAMVFAMLLSAIVWNLGTWFFGLPASSSHTLIGSIMGVGLANAMMKNGLMAFSTGLNWSKVKDIALALLVSPLVGFFCAAGLLLVAKWLIRNPALYRAPEGNAPPPWWIRGILILTCTGVSLAHGSNDGQKGMGLIVLILVGILPGMYALQMNASPDSIQQVAVSAEAFAKSIEKEVGPGNLSDEQAIAEISAYVKPSGKVQPTVIPALASLCHSIHDDLNGITILDQLPESQRREMRANLYLAGAAAKKLRSSGALTSPESQEASKVLIAKAESLTNYVPNWVKYAVALALGLGTMIGYKRIVVTVGEKIGKSHLTYAQGASAELVAMSTILVADRLGLPVSTTHVVSSGIAGTMAANRSGLQASTLRNILMAWILTLPVCVFLGAMLFALGLNLLLMFGLK